MEREACQVVHHTRVTNRRPEEVCSGTAALGNDKFVCSRDGAMVTNDSPRLSASFFQQVANANASWSSGYFMVLGVYLNILGANLF